MAELTKAYLDQRFDAVLDSVRQGFAEQRQRVDRVEANVATLTSSVDRFAKLFTDVNQEVVVLRQQLRDADERIDRLTLKLNAAWQSQLVDRSDKQYKSCAPGSLLQRWRNESRLCYLQHIRQSIREKFR